MREAWGIFLLVFGLSFLAVAMFSPWLRTGSNMAEPRIRSLEADIDRLQVELEKSKKETEVEYWSHQCECQTAKALKSCGCGEVVP